MVKTEGLVPPWVRAGLNIRADAADLIARLIELFSNEEHNPHVIAVAAR